MAGAAAEALLPPVEVATPLLSGNMGDRRDRRREVFFFAARGEMGRAGRAKRSFQMGEEWERERRLGDGRKRSGDERENQKTDGEGKDRREKGSFPRRREKGRG